MQQKIQSVVGNPESGPPTALGKFPDAETGFGTLPDIADSPQEIDEVQPDSDNQRSCEIAGGGRSAVRRSCSFAAWLLIQPIRFYQRFISPLFPPCCRFTPSCSAYAIEALRKRGFWVGCVLTVWRLLRCNPWCKGGYDPVPEKTQKTSSSGAEINVNEEK